MANQLETIQQLSETIAYQTGSTLTGIAFHKRQTEWRLMLKVDTPKGKHKVCFLYAPTVEDLLFLAAAAINSTTITLDWRDDKYWKP